jgi:hypothetical protein
MRQFLISLVWCNGVLLLLPSAGLSQADITLDHAKGKITVDGEDMSEKEIRLKTSGGVIIWVTNTNTALYDYVTNAEKLESPEIVALNAFAKDFTPYVPEIRAAIDDAFLEEQKCPLADGGGRDVAKELAKIDTIIRGVNGLQEVELSALTALREMNNKSGEPDYLEKEFGNTKSTRLNTTKQGCWKNTCSESIANALFSLRKYRQDLVETLRKYRQEPVETNADSPPCEKKEIEKYELLVKTATGVLDDSDELYGAALGIETLLNDVLGAKSVYSDTTFVDLEYGRSVTVKITPKEDKRRVPLAVNDPIEFKFKVFKDWVLRPSVGLSFLAANNAEFPKIGTKPVPGDSLVEIAESGTQDSRFEWGLTLGLTTRWTDWREESGLAIWLPELTINPSDDVRALGLGGAASWRIFKLGIGALWTRHEILDNDQRIGDKLPMTESPLTRQSYRDPSFYFSVSVFGWPRKE